MSLQIDPFAHHPELREKIADPAGSFFRKLTVDMLLQQFPQLTRLREWVHDDDFREANRAQALADHSGDLWVFGYGSLMWDPALFFSEVRRAHVDGFARRLILIDDKGGRGTQEAPGLMAALDHGGECHGLAFRIPAPDVDTETEVLWRREVIGPGYIPQFVTARIGDETVPALTFLADHAVPEIRDDLSRADQIRFLAHGSGVLGTSREYLANIVDHFETLEIRDDDCAALLHEVDTYLASLPSSPPNEADT